MPIHQEPREADFYGPPPSHCTEIVDGTPPTAVLTMHTARTSSASQVLAALGLVYLLAGVLGPCEEVQESTPRLMRTRKGSPYSAPRRAFHPSGESKVAATSDEGRAPSEKGAIYTGMNDEFDGQ